MINEAVTIIPLKGDLSMHIKLNLPSGKYITKLSPDYLQAGREGTECRAKCLAKPYYRCTRQYGHRGDHAAHGFVTSKRILGMFARWSD